MFVGEQPGDQEDLAGRPFVGPAGAVFDEALEKAGIPRSEVYVTNAVKHFKFIQRGKRRIHNKPDGGEIEACRWWIEQERALIRPPVTVALGATAARSILDKVVTISRVRGSPIPLNEGGECWVTVHPSFLLRIPEEDRRREEDYPVTTAGDGPCNIVMWNGVGGSTVHWEGHFPRLHQSDFAVRRLDGVAED